MNLNGWPLTHRKLGGTRAADENQSFKNFKKLRSHGVASPPVAHHNVNFHQVGFFARSVVLCDDLDSMLETRSKCNIENNKRIII